MTYLLCPHERWSTKYFIPKSDNNPIEPENKNIYKFTIARIDTFGMKPTGLKPPRVLILLSIKPNIYGKIPLLLGIAFQYEEIMLGKN